jgi:hypothetical protein
LSVDKVEEGDIGFTTADIWTEALGSGDFPEEVMCYAFCDARLDKVGGGCF